MVQFNFYLWSNLKSFLRKTSCYFWGPVKAHPALFLMYHFKDTELLKAWVPSQKVGAGALNFWKLKQKYKTKANWFLQRHLLELCSNIFTNVCLFQVKIPFSLMIIVPNFNCTKMKLSIKISLVIRPNLQFPVDMVTFTEEMFNRKLHFLRSAQDNAI